ncbi:hypothetical protein NQ315_005469 [Exocentrus adspersus]|uniref:U2 snRNP-associated SURP motif-containing protein n=1 Tax=Exocentrus adspersus TaxID=1586481 RepID=A0AAV8VT33_9CUCU|nr:hypothetical protein NQ315_005469 [Exocentrus adspersus]
MLSKKEYERRRREEQEATAHVFQEFIDTFQNYSPAPSKVFVKSGVLYSEEAQENTDAPKLYNPKPVITQNNTNAIKSAIECARILKQNNLEKAKKQEKHKSNLDLLKEELKLRHSERGEKERLKNELDLSTPALSYFEGGDPNSTNLFVANLSSKVTENHLMLDFGAFGPLASVKIMWPRGAEEKGRNSNCGFVAFMSRKDAERALKANKHREDMRVGWGNLLKLYLPPPLSGLPFNAQPPTHDYNLNCSEEQFEDLLYNRVVKVTIPLNKKVLMLVHRVIEFVVREGPMFEAFIMNREIGNPDFNFLFDFQNPIHVYYRWKLYSILVGDSKKDWCMKPFRMFKGGSIWLPPIAPNYSEGMPEQLIKTDEKRVDVEKLSETQCKRLTVLLRNLTMNRAKIAEGMMFCLNHKLALKDSLEVILESLSNAGTCPLKQVARLYLLSDVMFNAKQINIDVHDWDLKLLEVFKMLHSSFGKMKTAADKDNFKSRVQRVLQHWDVCKVMPSSFVRKAELTFMNNAESTEHAEDDNSSTDEPLDGANLLRRSLKNELGPDVVTTNLNEKKVLNRTQMLEYFVPSKWDTVDPEEVEAQAMSSEKMYLLELESKLNDPVVEEEVNREVSKERSDVSGSERRRCKHKGKRKRSKDGNDYKRSRSRKD